jgi:hypothetical protein
MVDVDLKKIATVAHDAAKCVSVKDHSHVKFYDSTLHPVAWLGPGNIFNSDEFQSVFKFSWQSAQLYCEIGHENAP